MPQFDSDVERLEYFLERREAEIAVLRKALMVLLEEAEDIREYTHDWDWKYGAMWDETLANARVVVSNYPPANKSHQTSSAP